MTQLDYAALCGQCERAYPNEGCGILLGTSNADDRHVRAIIPCENVRTHSLRSSYAIDPRTLVAAQRDARERSLEVIGFYHSHPDHAAEPSHRDLEEAHWNNCSYLIVAVISGHAADARSYVLHIREQTKAFEEESVRIDLQ